ncbi:Stk1 family PASTA domain-containing Ser/Thr kinase [Paenibacillus sp. MZ03-122A]|uniref:Stk1 family PASTA domain-containing Ser/Thr kinase n=1 Tax=Paenibacillus sp. MZ03-122A TaxID=2962033 RepID=UPI0020B8A663|nr:Stk1 family PASTA domain-containing Ser/Thr kinase [Paenibacillus sp. MZ03-122A]MCP3778205.1 Stk1 family PASTA domain-containing Ser/Thr kinase [Paenibacillus sp. MZ03-122A]
MIGHLLGGRYEIIERIGGGGMALVYKAQDILLNRNVAVKVLRQQFVHDEEFIRRFRREAQSAASLSHSNVVSIYDVGQEDEIHYIVMECIEGKNLNEIIKERAPLQVDEAVRIASQICDALEHAHQNQIIHRDIKPHNILIGRNGRVKVTDFGIARAVTSTTITQTGSVVGSVHYFSPEHAKGVVTGEKSDLYSLGIVLYQMLTAQLPFLGESPISVALKHLQEEFEEPRKINPLIPQSVENVILKSMRKNPEERYQSADEMLKDLETCLLPGRRNESKLEFTHLDDEDQTRVIPAIKPQQLGMSSSGDDVPAQSRESEQLPSKQSSKKNRKKAILWVTLVLVLLLCMGGVVYYVQSVLVVPEVKVPGVLTQTEDQAKVNLSKAGLLIEEPIQHEYKEGIAPGVVFYQSYPADSLVKEGTKISLKVGIAKPLTPMPDVKGQSYENAVKLLTAQQIKETQIQQNEQFSDQAAGTVLSQTPAANEPFDKDSVQVVLTVSKGADTVKMPSLVGKTQNQAENEVKKAGLKVGSIKEEFSYEQEKGRVTKQWPSEAGSELPPNTEITIYVSTGYPPEAITLPFNVPVAPKEEGKNSKIRITYTDARGENQEWGSRTINTTQVFTINLLMAPNKDSVVSVFRDGDFIDTYPVSYIDAKNGTVTMPQIAPPAGTSPTDTPDGTSSQNGSGNGEEGDSGGASNDSGNSGGDLNNQEGTGSNGDPSAFVPGTNSTGGTRSELAVSYKNNPGHASHKKKEKVIEAVQHQ